MNTSRTRPIKAPITRRCDVNTKFKKFVKIAMMLALGLTSYLSLQGCEGSWYDDPFFGKGGNFRS